MSKCSKTSYFYFCCRSELCDVPGSSGVIVRHSPSFIFKFFTSCFSPSSSFSSSFKVAGILFYNCRPITKKLPLLKDLTCTGYALLFCFGATFTLVLGFQWISCPGFDTSCILILQIQMTSLCLCKLYIFRIFSCSWQLVVVISIRNLSSQE